MIVTVADTLVRIDGWEPRFTPLCTYTLKVRKTPEEVKAERERKLRENPGSKPKIQNIKFEERREIHLDGDVAYIQPGLWPRISKELDKAGVQYTIIDKRIKEIRPVAAYERLSGIELRHGQEITLGLIATRDCGIIKCTTAFGKSFLIGCICKMYPTLNILVTTKSSQVVGTLYSYLSKLLPGEVGFLYARGNTAHGKRVVVTTLKSIGHIPPNEVHLLLCDECHEVGPGTYSKDISKFMFCRKFGFTASPIRNDGSFMAMEALFGPVIQDVSYEEAVAHGMVTPLKIAWLDCQQAPGLVSGTKTVPDVIQKKWSYWANRYRNQRIADYVKELLSFYDGQVLIMVETLEHAIYLNMMLPNFAVAHYGATDMASLRKKFPKEKFPYLDLSKYKMSAKKLDIMRAAFEKGTLKRVISTMTWKQGCDFRQLTVLIRADGVSSEVLGIQIPGRTARLYDGKEYAYIVDCDDRFSVWSARRTATRKKQYEKQKWETVTPEEVLNDLRRSSATGTDRCVQAGTGEVSDTDAGDAADTSGSGPQG